MYCECVLLQAGYFDCVTSWLTVLHFTDRRALFQMCHRVAKAGTGVFYAADFFDKAGLTTEER